MTTDADSISQAALRLSGDDRARLAEQLIGSLDDTEESGVEEAWADEVKRRSLEYDANAVTPIPWSEVRESAHRQLTR